MTESKKIDLSLLKKEIPYKWKIQSISRDGKKASCVAYIDARQAMDLLDEVVGQGGWQDKYRTETIQYKAESTDDKGKISGGSRDQLICSVGIKVDGEWIWKEDTGTESDYETEKGLFSDAFKRSCVKWGVGRFLYDMDIEWVNVVDRNPVDDAGKRIWDLTEYIENRRKERINAKPKKETAENDQLLRIKPAVESLNACKTVDQLDKVIGALIESKKYEGKDIYILKNLAEKRKLVLEKSQ
jgi:hypothetical protein